MTLTPTRRADPPGQRPTWQLSMLAILRQAGPAGMYRAELAQLVANTAGGDAPTETELAAGLRFSLLAGELHMPHGGRGPYVATPGTGRPALTIALPCTPHVVHALVDVLADKWEVDGAWLLETHAIYSHHPLSGRCFHLYQPDPT